MLDDIEKYSKMKRMTHGTDADKLLECGRSLVSIQAKSLCWAPSEPLHGWEGSLSAFVQNPLALVNTSIAEPV